MNRVFITGATGFIGKEVLRSALRTGYICRCLVRKGSENKLPVRDTNIEIVYGELPGKKSPYHFMEDCEAVINLVGIIREKPGKGITFQSIHIDAVKSLIDAALKRNIERFLHLSANGASPEGITDYQRSKGIAEGLLIDSGLKYTIFKPSVVWGDPEGREEFFSLLAASLFRNRFFPPFLPNIDGGRFRLSPVFVGDLADGIVKSLQNPLSERKIYTVGGKEEFSWTELLKMLKSVLKSRKPLVCIPSGLLKPIAWIMQQTGVGSLTLDQLKMLLAGNVCSGDEFFKDLNLRPLGLRSENLKYLYKHLKGEK